MLNRCAAIACPSLLIVCLLCAVPAPAAPAIEADLASRTAWTFRPDGGVAKPLAVPAGGWRLNGFPDAVAGTYERRIAIPKLPGGQPQYTELAFEAVNWEAVVLAGPDTAHLQEAGRHLSAWTPFRVEISRLVTPGQTAVVRVHVRDRSFFKDEAGRFTVPAATEWNDRQARGILRGVTLRVYPALSIEDVAVRPSTATNTLTCRVTVRNSVDRAALFSLQGRLESADRSGKGVSAGRAGAPLQGSYPTIPAVSAVTIGPAQRRTLTIGPIPWTPGRASWWWPNVPYRPGYRARLHFLHLRLIPSDPGSGRTAHRETVRFGFCSPGQTGAHYTLNGVRIRLRGDSLPEGTLGTDAFARLPGFLPPTGNSPGWPGAVRNYQRLNFNVVRMHQVPATRYMLDVCDELGLLVIPETAIRGGGIKKQNVAVQPEAFLTHLRELVLRDRNRPSVFKWSLENELFGAPEAFVRALYETCRAADDTRPCSIDDNADYPAWPAFAVIEHSSQPPGTPDAAGGKPRDDRPFGQGEYLWPHGNTAQGAHWMAMQTRALRAHDNADIRPYTLIDIWPGVIPGLTPMGFPDPPLAPVGLEQGGRSLLNPPDPWNHPVIQQIQKSFAPVAVFDPAFDMANTPSNSNGEWPAVMPILPAGQNVVRTVTVFNDDLFGSRLRLRIQPAAQGFQTDVKRLPEITRDLIVPPGEHKTVRFTLHTPEFQANATLTLLLLLEKEGAARYREQIAYTLVPKGEGGTVVRFEGRDDRTAGDWPGVYGKEGFLVPVRLGRSAFQIPEVDIRRGAGFEEYLYSPAIQEYDLKNLPRLVRRLRSAPQPALRYLWSRLKPGAQRQIGAYQEAQNPSRSLEKTVREELNRIVFGPVIYTKERFAGVKLGARTRALLARDLLEYERGWLNRLLLDDLFPGELTPGRGVFRESPFQRSNEQQGAMADFSLDTTTDDRRVPVRGPGLHERIPTVFAAKGEPMFLRVTTTDRREHRLSLYLVDFQRENRAVDVDIFDTQFHRLDTRRVDRYGEGAYLRYRFAGSVIVRIRSLSAEMPLLSGIFVDPAPESGLLPGR